MVKGFFDGVYWAGRNALVALAYFTFAYLSITHLSWHNSNACPVWPAAGLGLAVFLHYGYKIAPGVFLGATLANFLTFPIGASAFSYLVPAVGIGLGNSLEAALGLYYLKLSIPHPGKNLLLEWFIFCGISLGVCLFAAVNGAIWLSLYGIVQPGESLYALMTWLIGDWSGVLVVTPVLLACFSGLIFAGKLRSRIEALLYLSAVAAVSWSVFSWNTDLYPFAFFPVALLALGALRYPAMVSSAALAILSGIAIWATLNSSGPFGAPGAERAVKLIMLQSFLLSVILTVQVTSLTAVSRLQLIVNLNRTVSQRTASLEESFRNAERLRQESEADRNLFRDMLPTLADVERIIQQSEEIKETKRLHASLQKLRERLKNTDWLKT